MRLDWNKLILFDRRKVAIDMIKYIEEKSPDRNGGQEEIIGLAKEYLKTL